MNTKMPFSAWIFLILMIFGCGVWTYLTPTDPYQVAQRNIMIINVVQSYWFWVILVLGFFIAIFPPKIGSR